MSGHYCSNCGQEARIQLPTFREFIHEFVVDQVSLDGKFLRTLWALVHSPGRLSLEYVEGRRQRYVRPLRLYLTLSLAFFLTLGFVSPRLLDVSSDTPRKAVAAATQGSAGGPAEQSPSAKKPGADSESQMFQVDDKDSTGNAFLDRRIHAFSHLPEAEKARALNESLRDRAPYAIFVLMPLLAAGLQLLYIGSGRRYGEHFLFALHAQSFTYLAMLLGRITVLPVLASFGDAIDIVVLLSLVIYLYLAMRRFYGSRRWPTLWRMSLLLSGYSLALTAALAISALVAVVA